MGIVSIEMPAGTTGGGSANSGERTVFRPPWVKEKPVAQPVSSAPWTLKNRRESKTNDDSTGGGVATIQEPLPKFPQLRKTSGPQQPKENGKSTPHLEQVQLRPTSKEIKVEKSIPIQRDDSIDDRHRFPIKRNLRDHTIPIKPPPTTRRERLFAKTYDSEIPASHTLRKQDSILNIIPAAPPAPPAPPLPPPEPKIKPDGYKPVNSKQSKVLEMLRQRPRKRPDWGTMMKDIEQGKKLKHVECNDRSKPLLPRGKTKTNEGQFVYESEKEKSNTHNQLLKQIQKGVNLKRVQTNDRSKPNLDGLRKFRRQMTIEEQIQKSQSSAALGLSPAADGIVDVDDEIIIADEEDDIDKLRDDLQSTKQLLALELRNKEAQQKEIKRLQARIQNMETELDLERGKAAASVTRSVMAERIEDDKLVASLKQEAEDARKAAKESEKKFLRASDELDTIQGELDEAKRQNEILERRLEQALKFIGGGSDSRRQSQAPSKDMDDQDEEQDNESESDDDDDDGEETEEKKEKRAKRELKLLNNKLKSVKNKRENAKKERQSLKEQMKLEQKTIKEEKKKYKRLQREVDKMAELMKDDDKDDDDDEKEDNDDEYTEELGAEEVEEEESETESESSSESEDDEASDSEPEDAPIDKRKENYTSRVRRHENCLAALKKGNFLLKANIDRLKDDINKQRAMSLQLQQDLDSVLNDLG